MDTEQALHVALLPWLAMGHLIPFLHLSRRLAVKGLKVSYISTPKNITALHNLLPPSTTAQVNFISIPFSDNASLNGAESSMEIGNYQQAFLKTAFDSLQSPIAAFLGDARPDWIIYDFSCHWIPPIAAELGISCVFFSLFNASTMCYYGPPETYLARGQTRPTAEEMTASPSWMPNNHSRITYRLHEVKKFLAHREKSYSTDGKRFAGSIAGADLVSIRTSPELESEQIELLAKLYRKKVVPLGFLFPSHEFWGESEMKKWLDKQEPDSVLYVALGTEAALSQEELTELARGLESSGVAFLWVVISPAGSTQDVLEMLPDRFAERVRGRGFVWPGWAPQVDILGHTSVRGFLTHCGWNSVIEGLGYGRALVLLPFVNDQGLVARFLEGERLGVEVRRNESDGSFKSESVVESVRKVMVESEGEDVRENARNMRNVIGKEELNNGHVEVFINHLSKKVANEGNN